MKPSGKSKERELLPICDSCLDSPETGDASRSLLWAVAGVCSGGLLLLLVLRRRKEDEADA